MGTKEQSEIDKLVLDNQRLITYVIQRMALRIPCPMSMEDVAQEGQIGLVRAAQNFDRDAGLFSTFAYHSIRGSIMDGVIRAMPMSRADYHRLKRENEFENIGWDLCEDIQQIRWISKAEMEEFWNARVERIDLKNALKTLDEQERRVIELIYFRGMSMRSVQKKMYLSKRTVQKIHGSALIKLKKYMA